MIYVPKQDVESIVKLAYPDYKGKKFKVTTAKKYYLQDYWDGGTRHYIKFVSWNIEEEKWEVKSPPSEIHNPMNKAAHQDLEIPNDVLFVEHTIFQGKDTGIRIYMSQDSIYAPQLITQEIDELSIPELIVLVATRSLKSSYMGIRDYRFHRAKEVTGITRECWDCTKAELIEKGYLNKAGAITMKGKNAIPDKYYDLFQFKGKL